MSASWRATWVAILPVLLSLCAGCATIDGYLNPETPRPRLQHLASVRPRVSPDIDSFLEKRAQAILANPEKMNLLRGVEVSAALVSMGRYFPSTEPPFVGAYRGDRRLPAGEMVALPYAAYYFSQSRTKALRGQPDLRRLVVSLLAEGKNLALNSLLDAITGTESGPPLEGPAFEEFKAKRAVVNTWLGDIGLHPPLRASLKVWDTSPYGRDFQLLGTDYANENVVTATALARLLILVADGALAPGEDALAMLRMMLWERARPGGSPTPSVMAAEAPPRLRVYAFAGARSDTFQDCVILEAAGGVRFILVVLADKREAGAEFAKLLARDVFAAIQAGQLPIPATPNAPL